MLTVVMLGRGLQSPSAFQLIILSISARSAFGI